MDSRRQIQQLLQDSILNLCKTSLDVGQFEVDGIICISSPKDDQQIVVKMHEFIETSTDGGLPGARNSHLQQHQGRNSISSNGSANRMPSMFTAGSKPNQHSKHQFETLTQVLGSQGANTNDKEEVEDSGSKKKKVKIFEIIDEPLDSSPSEDHTPWNSENLPSDDNQLEVITVPDNNIPQEVALAVSKVMGSFPKRATPSPQGGRNVVKKAKVTVAHPNKNSPITGPGPYICDGCRRQFGTRTSLSLHVVKKHSSYAMVYCGACQTGFVDRNTFSAHTCVKSHPSTDVVDPENDFIDQGGKLDVQSNNTLRSLLTAERMGARLRHADSVASRQPYVIDETDALLDEAVDSPASSTGRQAEGSPLNSTDEQDRNECTVCSQVFDTFEDLEKHVWRRHKRYPCPHCFKTFTEKYTRERHYRIHTGVKPFRCGPCDRGFTRRDHLRTHCDTAHGYPTNLFDLNYKSGTFYPPGDNETMETDSPAVLSADDIEITDSPVAQIVDEFIPLDGVDQEDSPLRFEPKTSDTHSGIPVFPMPTEIDHQAEWEEETSASVSHTEEHQQENISESKESEQGNDAGVLKLEPTDPELDIL